MFTVYIFFQASSGTEMNQNEGPLPVLYCSTLIFRFVDKKRGGGPQDIQSSPSPGAGGGRSVRGLVAHGACCQGRGGGGARDVENLGLPIAAS